MPTPDCRSILLFALISVSGCTPPVEQRDEPAVPGTAAPELIIEKRPLNPDWSDQESLVFANSDFAFDLYAKLRRQPGNLVYSPYNISLGLAMCYAGARGETEAQLKDALRLPLDSTRLHPAWKALAESVQSQAAEQKISLNLANRLWADESLSVDPGFLQLSGEAYGADLAQLNLLSDRMGAARQIDAWINQQTHGKLGDSTTPSTLPSNANMVLTCAIYFKADWSYPFFEQGTKPAAFHIDRKQSVEVPMMHYEDIVQAFRLATADEAQILELKYGLPSERTGEFRMLILLPNSDDGLAALECQLTTDNLNRWVDELAPGHIDVFLPRFRVASQSDLAPALKAMGATDAFSPSAADFTGMGDGGLYLTDAVQAAVVSVDEEGTEAAAATRFVYGAEDDSKPLLFRADHPFLFLIRHSPTGSILFVGRVENPLQ